MDVSRVADKTKMDQVCGLPEFHVLVVDDSDLNRKIVERMLKKVCCCKVTVAESGTRALVYLEERTDEFNLIITDYDMPGMTGLELLQKIKGFSKIPVVIMSSENTKDRVDRCMEECAERFLVKPVKVSDLQSIKDCILMNSASTSASNTTVP